MSHVGFHRHDKVKEHAEFIIDETFGVPGVGTVIAGTVKRGVITTNANLMLGPDVGDGTFKPTAIKSIQYKRLPVTRVKHSLSCSLVFTLAPASTISPVLAEADCKLLLEQDFACSLTWSQHTLWFDSETQAISCSASGLTCKIDSMCLG